MTGVFTPNAVLVTGGAGFVGSHVAIAIKARFPGARVLAFDNLRRRGSDLQLGRLRERGVEFLHGDVRSTDDLASVGAVDLVVDAAAECSVMAGVDSDPGYLMQTNLVGTLNLLETARHHRAALIFISTSRVYPVEALRRLQLAVVGERYELASSYERRGIGPRGISEGFPLDGYRTLYGTTKLAAELLVEEYRETYGLRSVVNRCGVVAGPWQMGRVDQGVVGFWCARHLWGGSLGYFGYRGYQVRDLLHVEDLAELMVKQLSRIGEIDGATFNVGGGLEVSVSLCELTRACRQATGKRLDVAEVDGVRAGDVPWYVTDTGRLQKALEWRPRRNVAKIIGDTVAWLDSNASQLRPLFT